MKKPNILFILSDDQGPWALGCAGTPELITPNIDKLASEGMRCTNFFCASPVCSPARASILTGTIPSKHGVLDWIAAGSMEGDLKDSVIYNDKDKNEPIQYLKGFISYTDILAQNGYICGLSGKWHLGDSFTPQMSLKSNYVCQFGGGSYYNHPVIKDGVPCLEPKYLTDAITDNAIEFIEENATRQNPFYLSVHYTAPHTPWINNHPKEFVEMYDNCIFSSLPVTALKKSSMWPQELVAGTDEWKENLKGYFASITAMDMNIGRIVDILKLLGIYDNTLIVFTSDNGFNCGHHGIWGKGNGTFPLNMYDESVKVPAVFCHKGVIKHNICENLLSAYDIMPTLLDYVGIKIPGDEKRPGKSFVYLLKGEEYEDRENVVIFDEYGPVRMIRSKKWKYIHRYSYGPHELYDLENDPGEDNNLIDKTDYIKITLQMRSNLFKWFDKYADPINDGSKHGVTGLGQTSLSTGINPWRTSEEIKKRINKL